MQEKVIFQWHAYFFLLFVQGSVFRAMKIIQPHLLYILKNKSKNYPPQTLAINKLDFTHMHLRENKSVSHEFVQHGFVLFVMG